MFNPYFNQSDYNIFDMTSLNPILMMLFLCILLIVLLYCYNKIRIPLLIFILYLFILIVGFTTMKDKSIPLTPFIQILVMLFATVIFITVVREVFDDTTYIFKLQERGWKLYD